jgi:predicted hydrocarbon binding protein
MTTATERDLDLRIGKRAMHQLRAVLERETASRAPLLLREIGFATGEALSDRFEQWVREHYRVDSARELDFVFLGEALSGFFAETGWGAVTLSELVPQVLALDAPDWGEAQSGGSEYPSCHFSCGALADFFTRLSGIRAAVMEVECRSRGEERCRFLIGSPDLLTYAYERMAAGMPYREALAG